MGLSKFSLSLLTLTCLIIWTNGSVIKTPDHEPLVPQPSTFGIKTVTKQTTHSNNGVVTRVFKETKIQSGSTNSFQQNPQSSTGNQAQFSSSQDTHSVSQDQIVQTFPDIPGVGGHSFVQDGVVPLLPVDNVKPAQYGSRLVSSSKQSHCSVKGGCSSKDSISTGNVFENTNTGGHQVQISQQVEHKDQGQDINTNFEQKELGNTQPQDSFAGQEQQQEQQAEEILNEFADQYVEALKDFAQGDGIADNIQIPIADTQFPEQGDSKTEFDVGSVVPYLEQQPKDTFIQQQNQDDSQDVFISPNVNQQNVPFNDVAQVVEQQGRNFEFDQGNYQQQQEESFDDVGDQNINFELDRRSNHQQEENVGNQNTNFAIDQRSYQQQEENNRFEEGQNTNFGIDQGNFQQQEENVGFEGGQNTNFAYDQGSSFQQQFVPQSHVTNENNFNFQDERQDFFYSDPIEALRYNVPGNPGEDYPILYQVPETPFNCNQQQFATGIYGDTDAQCQVFHFCTESGHQNSFLCPNGTVFNQQYFVCDWWYNYNCSDTPSFYNLNAQLYWDINSFEPSQIQTGAGIESTEEQVGQFPIQVNTQDYSNYNPNQEEFQTSVTHTGNQQVHTFSSQSVEQHGTNSFVESRQDGNIFQTNVGSISIPQSNLGQNTNFVQQAVHEDVGKDFNTHSVQTQNGDFHSNNKPQPTTPVTQIPSIDSNAGSFTQTKIESSNFQQESIDHQTIKPDGGNFGQRQTSQSQENVNSADFTQQVKQSQLDTVTSSDIQTGWSPEPNNGIGYPNQNDFVQQNVDDQHQFQSTQDTHKNIVNNVAQDQIDIIPLAPQDVGSFDQFTQNDFVPTESTTSFNEQNQNIPQSEIQQEVVQFPLEVSVRSDEDGVDLGIEDNSGTFSRDGFTTTTPQNEGQQQNIDFFEDNVSFRRQALFPSSEQATIEENQKGQTLFNNFQTTTVQPSLIEASLIPDTFEEVGEDNQSARDNDDGVINQEQQKVSNAFDGQQLLDVNDAVQDAVNYDEILNGFRSRNVAFMNVKNVPQSFDNNYRVYENRPAQVHALAFRQNSNENAHVNAQEEIQNQNFQQQNIKSDNSFNVKGGVSNNFQHGNQQRLNFRPYGQNLSPTSNNNFNEQTQIKNEDISNANQNLNQEVHEKVIFPVEQKQGSGQNQWWHNSQNSANQQGGNQNNNDHVSQSHAEVGGTSNKNLNVPTNAHQAQSFPSVKGNQQQNPRPEDKNFNLNTQRPIQENAVNPHLKNDQTQFQRDIGQPQFYNNNENIQQQFQNQHQFQNVNDQSRFHSVHNQPEFQNVNNHHQFQNQQEIQNVNNQPQFHNANNQPQLHNFENQQQFQNQNHFQNPHNQPQFYNVNNQQQHQNINSQQSFNNVNQPQIPNTEQRPVQNFEQNSGPFVQGQQQVQNIAEFVRTVSENVQQNPGVKGFHQQQNFREARNFNLPTNPQTINADDIVSYSQNDPKAAESAISYNGWKPIVRS
ncbi:chitin-binding type-2 domain-containing protein [Caerostris darwini]|uniref:Chitin-binding type-2 domain-containing protein n=1 Tax=Caerostris darwini TaxID=1538125 RepID=A0AAV4P1I3_9ARAC|nr:chitin-binding type-2 domain-containing protein [Caerostris darwini]